MRVKVLCNLQDDLFGELQRHAVGVWRDPVHFRKGKFSIFKRWKMNDEELSTDDDFNLVYRSTAYTDDEA